MGSHGQAQGTAPTIHDQDSGGDEFRYSRGSALCLPVRIFKWPYRIKEALTVASITMIE